MARGFESKSVADQQEARQAEKPVRGDVVPPDQKRLQLARADIEQLLRDLLGSDLSLDGLPDVVTVGSGNLGLVWFPQVPHRLSLEDLQERFGLTYLFISHDLSMVRQGTWLTTSSPPHFTLPPSPPCRT